MLKSFDDISSIANDLALFSGTSYKDMERRLMILEEENKQLTSLSFYKSETERLRVELSYANSLKHKYRNMYNEVAVKLMYLQNTDSLIFEENDEIVSLNRKVELLKYANEDLKKTADEAKNALETEKTTKDRLLSEVIPQLQQQIHLIQTQNSQEPLTNTNLSKNTNFKTNSNQFELQIALLEHTQVSANFRQIAKGKEGRVLSGDDCVNIRKNASTSKHNSKGLYLPSFMRSKRVLRKDKFKSRKEL